MKKTAGNLGASGGGRGGRRALVVTRAATMAEIVESAPLPGLDHAARWLLARIAGLEPEHATTTALLTAMRTAVDEERDKRLELARGQKGGADGR